MSPVDLLVVAEDTAADKDRVGKEVSLANHDVGHCAYPGGLMIDLFGIWLLETASRSLWELLEGAFSLRCQGPLVNEMIPMLRRKYRKKGMPTLNC